MILYFCFSTLQVFDSNVNKDKLLRLKLGSGKVIKVELLAFHCNKTIVLNLSITEDFVQDSYMLFLICFI